MPSDLTVTHADVITEHREWLQKFGNERLKKWEDLLKSNPEGAICEAMTRKLLSTLNVEVQPYENLSTGGPDFLCKRNNKKFYAEVACITINSATKGTGLNNKRNMNKLGFYDYLTQKCFYEMIRKADQCSNLGAASILIIATLHFKVSLIGGFSERELLTGTPYVEVPIDKETDKLLRNPYYVTRLRNSVFIRRKPKSKKSIEDARKTISAVLLCGFGYKPHRITGVLHPNSNYPFDRTLLPSIRFARLADGWKNGKFKVEWI